MYGCQQIPISRNSDLINKLIFLCKESHKLTNMGIYYAIKLYFKCKKALGNYNLYNLGKIYKSNNHDRVLTSQAVRQVLITFDFNIY